MADNSSLPVASGNETFANEDIGGVKYPTPKVTWGPTGTSNRVDIASGKALPIQIRSATGLIPGGEPTDAAATATDTTSVSWTSLLKQISKSIQLMVFGAGTAAAAQRTTLASDDPAVATLGATADAAVTAGATGSISAKLRSISRDLIANIVLVGRTGGIFATGTNGYLIASPLLLIGGTGNTNGLDALASGGAATAAAALAQTDTGHAKYGYIYYQSGDTTWTPVGAGANLAGWFLLSTDGGTTFEDPQNTASTTVPALSRPVDFTIPLDLVASGTAGKRKFASGGPIRLPAGSFKTVIQNNGGATTGDTTAVHAGVYCLPVGDVL